jgi:hypothetical protein
MVIAQVPGDRRILVAATLLTVFDGLVSKNSRGLLQFAEAAESVCAFERAKTRVRFDSRSFASKLIFEFLLLVVDCQARDSFKFASGVLGGLWGAGPLPDPRPFAMSAFTESARSSICRSIGGVKASSQCVLLRANSMAPAGRTSSMRKGRILHSLLIARSTSRRTCEDALA